MGVAGHSGSGSMQWEWQCAVGVAACSGSGSVQWEWQRAVGILAGVGRLDDRGAGWGKVRLLGPDLWSCGLIVQYSLVDQWDHRPVCCVCTVGVLEFVWS